MEQFVYRQTAPNCPIVPETMRSLLAANRPALPTTALMCCTSFWLFAEQNLMAPSLSAVAAEFGFSDQEKDLKVCTLCVR